MTTRFRMVIGETGWNWSFKLQAIPVVILGKTLQGVIDEDLCIADSGHWLPGISLTILCYWLQLMNLVYHALAAIMVYYLILPYDRVCSAIIFFEKGLVLPHLKKLSGKMVSPRLLAPGRTWPNSQGELGVSGLKVWRRVTHCQVGKPVRSRIVRLNDKD